MSNPLSAVDAVVVAAIREHPKVLLQVVDALIQFWDDDAIAAFDVEDAAAMGPRIWIAPLGTDPDFESGNVTVDFIQRYRIGYATGDGKLTRSRDIEWAILAAMALLYMNKGPDGVALGDGLAAAIAPLFWDVAVISKCDIEREVARAEVAEWRGLCDVEVRTHCAVTDIVVA